MNDFRVAQKVIIKNDKDEVLTVRFSSHKTNPKGIHGWWDFPGGGINYKEDLREALMREVHEELGDVEIKIGQPIVVWDFLMQHGNAHCVVIGYDAQWQSGTIQLNEEHDEYQWINPDKLIKLTMGPGMTKAVNQYLELRRER